MKITQEHYQHIKTAIADKIATLQPGAISEHENMVRATRPNCNVNMRMRWDLWHSTRNSKWVCDNIYPYANDDHIDTALNQAMKDLGLPYTR